MTKEIKHVEQVHRSGCGIACAAMVKGITYEQALDWWKVVCGGNPDRLTAVGSGAGLRLNQLRDLLATMACEVPVIQAPAILVIQKPNNIQHFVVVTAEGKILDPLDP